jgi:hypothetical protein
VFLMGRCQTRRRWLANSCPQFSWKTEIDECLAAIETPASARFSCNGNRYSGHPEARQNLSDLSLFRNLRGRSDLACNRLKLDSWTATTPGDLPGSERYRKTVLTARKAVIRTVRKLKYPTDSKHVERMLTESPLLQSWGTSAQNADSRVL